MANTILIRISTVPRRKISVIHSSFISTLNDPEFCPHFLLDASVNFAIPNERTYFVSLTDSDKIRVGQYFSPISGSSSVIYYHSILDIGLIRPVSANCAPAVSTSWSACQSACKLTVSCAKNSVSYQFCIFLSTHLNKLDPVLHFETVVVNVFIILVVVFLLSFPLFPNDQCLSALAAVYYASSV